MAIERWNPSRSTTAQEKALLSRLGRHRKLFGFLRERRHELFDEAFSEELEGMYRSTGAGKEPVCPGLMAMAVLLQGYDKVSDAEAVERTVIDLRWQMVLDRLGATQPAFSQGAFQEFRQRMIRNDFDLRLLERVARLAKESGAFDPRKLPKTLRVAIDSMPLEGAGRVEDTINLLAHAGRKVAECAARLLDWTAEEVCQQAGATMLSASSVKAALDRTWSDPDERHEAVEALTEQLVALELWLRERMPGAVEEPPLKKHIDTLHQLVEQDLEPDPDGGSGVHIAQGVAPDRRVSVEDKQMRHGRKSKSRRFDGFKRHLAVDLDTGLIVACALAPANEPEEHAAASLREDMKADGRPISDLYIDRGYINAPLVTEVANDNGQIICRPWQPTNGALYPKTRFTINLRDRTVRCPEGHAERFTLGTTVNFDAATCDRCPSRSQCTDAAPGTGRSLRIAANEPLQKRLRKLLHSPSGRRKLRERVDVEHALSHAGRRQGRRARYLGVRRNLWDWRRASAITNLETIHRQLAPAAQRKAA